DLHTKLRLQSFCNQLQSVVIRKLIEQMHYRLTLEVAGEFVSTDLQQITSLFYPHLDILLSDLEHHIKPQKTHGSSIWSMNSRTWQLKHFKSVATAEFAAMDTLILTATMRARKTRIHIIAKLVAIIESLCLLTFREDLPKFHSLVLNSIDAQDRLFDTLQTVRQIIATLA
ncbi:MAG: hypothetical protein EBZ77_12995, partial [Chitinophagia bacterium]|nr:hypothetical protein [Chitinophagia bacterium]